jgi:HAD superfamily hydrolase (TIGR01509 family)
MIKNVIFDLGRVLYNFWPREDLLALGFDEARANRFMERVFDNPAWREADKGMITVAEHINNVRKSFPDMADDLQQVFGEGWKDRLITIMPESLDFYYEVKKRGFRIFIITDFAADTFAHCRARDTFFDEAEGIIVSARENLLKPDPAIFRCLLSRYALDAEECLFIDDLPKNIAAAKDLGMQGIQFKGIEDCKRQFEELLG